MSSIAIVGKSGEGKSTSIGNMPELGIEGLDPKKTYYINVAGKDLPFRGWSKQYNIENKNYSEASESKKIAELIRTISEKAPHITSIVVDDAQYTAAFEFLSRAKEPGYNKFTDIGVNLNTMLQAAKNTRKDLKVFFFWHPEDKAEYGFKMKTLGAMMDNYLTLEGLFTVILYSRVSKGTGEKMEYQFVTNHDGKVPAKSPAGMFLELYIKNDLGQVVKAIDAYN
jgi:hypothetical protein